MSGLTKKLMTTRPMSRQRLLDDIELAGLHQRSLVTPSGCLVTAIEAPLACRNTLIVLLQLVWPRRQPGVSGDNRATGLLELPDSIGNFKELKILKMWHCRVRTLPRSIEMLKKLQELDANQSYLRGEIPTEIGKLSRLRILDLSYTDICMLPLTISHLSSLEKLGLEVCNNLEELPRLPASLTSLCFTSAVLKWVPDFSNPGNLTNMTLGNIGNRGPITLRLSLVPGKNVKVYLEDYEKISQDGRRFWSPKYLGKCFCICMSNIETLPTELLGSVSQLNTLVLGCRGLLRIPPLPSSLSTLALMYVGEDTKLPCLSNLKNLSYLILCDCLIGKVGFESLGVGELEQLETLVLMADFSMLDGLQIPGSLQMFELVDCAHVQKLPDFSHLKSLQVLKIENCNELLQLPDLEELVSLQLIKIDGCKSLKSLGPHLPAHLKILSQTDCGCLRALPDLSHLKLNLKLLVIWDAELPVIPGLRALESLEGLAVLDCHSLGWLWPRVQSQRSMRKLRLKNLQELAIRCDRIMEISGLGELESLRVLYINSCNSLKTIRPHLPASLEKLDISSCPSLEQFPDISNLKNVRELTIISCNQLGEIPGLGGLKVDIVKVDLQSFT
ncbi:hypothetical protein CRG98_026378 [Punica granatum]|uniref:Uncharacterized protein n=2 Tax=Punica granatum TaxID=22663 RepID=A0A2I0JC58_PUNGR|nr:hypothetical protein CRG98_026378 [Punica granatum]